MIIGGANHRSSDPIVRIGAETEPKFVIELLDAADETEAPLLDEIFQGY
jgi:hypothetical protein